MHSICLLTDFSNKEKKMSTNCIQSLTLKKQYVNLPTKLIDTVRELYGPALASAWEVFYTESRLTHGVLKKTYDYLAHKIGCSRKTVIRYAKKLVEAGVLIINKRFYHNCPIENEFILLTPEEALLAAQNAPDRETKDLDIDYSVDYLVENSNSVDKSGSSCPYSILDLNYDINNKNKLSGKSGQLFAIRESRTKASPVNALRQENEPRNQEFDQNSSHLVPIGIVKHIEKYVKAQRWVSNPIELVQEAVYYLDNRKEGVSIWAALGAFKKLLGKDGRGGWTTPWGMVKKVDENNGYQNER
jgi:Helix-turn-helix domain